MPLVLPPTVLGFYLLLLMGPQGPVGQLTQCARARPAALHLRRAGGGLGDLLAALRRAAAAAGLRGDPGAHAGGRRHAARQPLGPLLQRRAAAGAAGLRDGQRARLRAHGGRVRRGADDRRQHPRQDARALGGDLRPRRGHRVRRCAPARRRHGGVRAGGAGDAVRGQPAARASARSAAHDRGPPRAAAARLHARRGAGAARARRHRAVRPLGLRQDHACCARWPAWSAPQGACRARRRGLAGRRAGALRAHAPARRSAT